MGSFGSGCNYFTGQGVCREGVIGRRCDSYSNPYAEVTLIGCDVGYDQEKDFADNMVFIASEILNRE